jgi:ADP-heptose:LPS heptosyltransferase
MKATQILVVRPDRLGDVILSTPVIEALKRHYPESRISFLVQESSAPVIRGIPGVDEVLVWDPKGRHSGIEGFFKLVSEIRARKISIGVVMHSQWKIAAALFVAGVRHRVGTLSKPHSYFFYNRGVRQQRSLVEMHETDYNLQLLRRLGVRAGSRYYPVRAHVSEQAREAGRSWLSVHGITAGQDRFIMIHPGMGGSALNWPETHYLELMRALLLEGHRVVLSGGPTEIELMTRLRDGLYELGEKVVLLGGGDAGPIDRFAGVLCWATLLVAPSTGPLHLAVALGVRVMTFYSPIRVQSALRWGPYLADESRASVLVPEVYCGRDFTCRGNLCNYFLCMKGLLVSQALEQVHFQLKQEELSHG